MVKWCTYHVNASLDLMLQTLKMFLSGKCSFQPPFGSPAHITVCMCFQKHDFKCFWFPFSFWTWDVWVQGVNVSCFGFLIWLCETTELGLWLKLSDIHVLFVRWWFGHGRFVMCIHPNMCRGPRAYCVLANHGCIYECWAYHTAWCDVALTSEPVLLHYIQGVTTKWMGTSHDEIF